MAREWLERPNQDQIPARKFMAALKYNNMMAFHHTNLYLLNSGLVVPISLELNCLKIA
jgi:hypothetical protein